MAGWEMTRHRSPETDRARDEERQKARVREDQLEQYFWHAERSRGRRGDAFSMMSAFGRTSVEPVHKSIKATSNHSSLLEEFMAAHSIS